MAVLKKNPAAVALGRKGGRKGGLARAAKLTPEQRSESARKAVQARWAKAKEGEDAASAVAATGTSDQALLALLKRIKTETNPTQVRRLASQIERVVFHKQFENA